jgi:hypothetical protein
MYAASILQQDRWVLGRVGAQASSPGSPFSRLAAGGDRGHQGSRKSLTPAGFRPHVQVTFQISPASDRCPEEREAIFKAVLQTFRPNPGTTLKL